MKWWKLWSLDWWRKCETTVAPPSPQVDSQSQNTSVDDINICDVRYLAEIIRNLPYTRLAAKEADWLKVDIFYFQNNLHPSISKTPVCRDADLQAELVEEVKKGAAKWLEAEVYNMETTLKNRGLL